MTSEKAEPGAVTRLQKELLLLEKDPVPFVKARPDPSNILHWYYIIEGPPETPYVGGHYFGLIQFPPSYPWKPPAFYIYTPSGRFTPNHKLCMSMSDYHPETWSQAWRISTLLTGLLSFMVTTETNHIGGITTSDAEKVKLAKESLAWNRKHQPKFPEMYPEFMSGPPPSLMAVHPPPSASTAAAPAKASPTSSIVAATTKAQSAEDDAKLAQELQAQWEAEARAQEEADAALARQLSEL